jgi:hypothetical protein
MKTLMALLFALCSLSALAEDQEPYKFEFFEQGNDHHIFADLNGMTYIGETARWSLVAHWEPHHQSKKYQLLHSITLFGTEQRTDVNAIKFERIFTYGVIDCSTSQLHILNEFYTDEHSRVVLSNKFDYNQYVVDLNYNVILQTLLIYSCRSEPT